MEEVEHRVSFTSVKGFLDWVHTHSIPHSNWGLVCARGEQLLVVGESIVHMGESIKYIPETKRLKIVGVGGEYGTI